MPPRDHLRGFISIKQPSGVCGGGGAVAGEQHMPVIPILRRLQLEHHEFEASLDLHSRSLSQRKKKKKRARADIFG